MADYQVITKEHHFPPVTVERIKDVDEKNIGWRMTVDSRVAKLAKLVFAAVATVCVITWAPIAFVAMTLVGCYFGSSLEWAHDEASRIWHAKIYTNTGDENHVRKVVIGGSLGATAYCFPAVAGIVAGQYVGSRLSPFLGGHLRNAVSYVSSFFH